MGIRCDEHGRVCVVTVEGDLCGDRAAEVCRAAEAALARPGGGVVVDLAGCDFVDSSGLEALCAIRRRCDAGGGRMALARVTGGCAKILQITRLAGRFDCHSDVSRAVAAAR